MFKALINNLDLDIGKNRNDNNKDTLSKLFFKLEKHINNQEQTLNRNLNNLCGNINHLSSYYESHAYDESLFFTANYLNKKADSCKDENIDLKSANIIKSYKNQMELFKRENTKNKLDCNKQFSNDVINLNKCLEFKTNKLAKEINMFLNKNHLENNSTLRSLYI